MANSARHARGTARKSAVTAALAALLAAIAAGLSGGVAAQDLGTPPGVILEPEPREQAYFGRRVATGDIDGDGFVDLVVTSYDAAVETGDGLLEGVGEAFAFFGPDFTRHIALPDPTPREFGEYGIRAAVGDVDGDGYADVFVSAVDSETAPIAGEIQVFSGPDLHLARTLEAPVPSVSAVFGGALATCDLDLDGFDDLVAGAYGEDVVLNGVTIRRAGRVYLHPGPDLSTPIVIDDPTPEEFAFFGFSVACGDVNHDGLVDLIVGTARGINVGHEVHVFHGPEFTSWTRLVNPYPDENGGEFGASVASGDVTGDGIDDVIVGDPNAELDTGVLSAGAVIVFAGPDLTETVPLQDPVADFVGLFGEELAVGDVNADGIGDVIAGSRLQDVGEAFVFFGPDLATAANLLDPMPTFGQFGTSMATGDTDGDGVDDVVVSAPLADVATGTGLELLAAGKVFVFPGNPDRDGDGLPDAVDPDPTTADADGDGIPDGADPDTVAAAVVDLDIGVFSNSADPEGQRRALLQRLEGIEQSIADGDVEEAIRALRNLLRRIDGCPAAATAGETADSDDWIVDCDAQREVRALIEILLQNLGG